ncbi:MAG: VWA domain-containing protein [Anaerolineales bacterium]|nr:VWA domain-containing protein [Anaerolineales bacterium]
MTAPLNLTSTLSSVVVPVTGKPRLVYLLMEVTGGEGAEALPSSLGFIIDTSDSMRIRLVTDEQFIELVRSGQAQEVMTDGVPAYQIKDVSNELISQFPRRIDYASQALVVASEYLRPLDCFSVIAFAGRSYCMIPFTSGKDRMRLHQAARELEYLKLGDDTQMAEGIAMAFAEIQQQTERPCSDRSYTSRLILLTDGHTRNVSECYEWAKKAHQAGVKLSTMGIGVEFNEDLLIPLADMTGGNAYYIETPDQIPDAFRQELGAALRISYRNVEIKVQLPGGVELRRVHRVFPELGAFDQGPNLAGAEVNAGSSYSLMMGDYDPAEPQALLLEVVLPAWDKGSYRLAQAMLTWEDPQGGLARPSQRQDVVVQMAGLATLPLNGRVMNIVEKVGAFKMGTQALAAAQDASKTADQGDKKAATVRLREAATRLLDMGEASMADAMLRQAETLERSGSVDPEAAKKLRYETRRLTQGL